MSQATMPPHAPAAPAAPAAPMPTAPAPASPTQTKPQQGWFTGIFGIELLDNRYPVLHGLRVLGILSVVQYHVTAILALERKLPLDQGFVAQSLSIFFGMDLFFLLSGFLIGSILLQSLRTTGSQNLRRFYLRRVFRTFPSYYIVLTALALLTPLTAAEKHNLPYHYVYLSNFFSLRRNENVMSWSWSLSLEEQFYLTVPLVFFGLSKLKMPQSRILALLALWLVPLGLRILTFLEHPNFTAEDLRRAVYFPSHTRFDTIVAGIILAFIEQQYGTSIANFLGPGRNRALLSIPALTCLWLLLDPGLLGASYTPLVRMFSWGTLTSIMYVCVLLLLLHGTGPLHRLLARPVFRVIATLGYGVYLIHIPVINIVFVPLATWLIKQGVALALVWPLVVVSAFALSLGGGYLMHIAIEKPSMRLRERFAA